MTQIPPYPLAWPEGVERTKTPTGAKFQTTLFRAIENVRESLRKFGNDAGRPVKNVVVTTNASLFDQRPADTGIAVWFDWDGATRCIAIDRYSKIEHNVQAVHHVIEARRTELRHGGLNIVRQTFAGFQHALPAPGTATKRTWWQVLGIAWTPGEAVTEARIAAAYRAKAKEVHPDHGGSDALMAELNAARDEALKKVNHG